MTAPTFAQLAPIFPELLLAAGALALILFGAFAGNHATGTIAGITLSLMTVAAILIILQDPAPAALFGGSFVVENFARFLKVLTLGGAIGALAVSLHWLRAERLDGFEFSILILLSTLGMMLMISANDLIAVYLGLELQSLALYVIAAFHRDDARSSEAGLKYFVLGALASGMLLYGCSLIYGYAGTISFQGIAQAVAHGAPPIGLVFGLVFLIAGLAFKVSAVPFHMWTPDVYEGAPTPVTTFFAAAPKAAAMAILVRVVIEAFPAILFQWQQIIVFIAIASMVLGAFAGIGQRNIKRLMAYSSIGHVGFVLVGLAAGTSEGVRGVLIYLVIYVITTLGMFACILAMRRESGAVEEIDELSGLAHTQPGLAFVTAMLLFSLAGIPWLAGFFAKFYVFLAAINAGLYGLAVIGVLASVIGAYYYLRIVKVIYFDEPRGGFVPMPLEMKAVIVLAGLFTLFYAVWPAPLIAAAEAAARSLF